MSLSPVFARFARAMCVSTSIAGLTGCVLSQMDDAKASTLPPSCRHIQSGKASWYGEEMAVAKRNGRYVFNRTASGDVFIPGGISAAHKTLPLGTRIKVVTRDNRALNVKVNDRGPYAKGRILDLSRGAAEQLGIKGKGEAFVSLYHCPNG